MWSASGLNGDFRRKPIVSNRGASKKETKEQLLERATKERLKREVRQHPVTQEQHLKPIFAVEIPQGDSVRHPDPVQLA